MSNRAAWSVLFAVLAVSACGGASDSDFFGEPSAGAKGTTGGTSGSGTSGGAGGTKATGGGSGKGGSGTGGSATGGTTANGGTSGSSTGGSSTGGSATGGTSASGGSGGTSDDGGASGEGSGATGGSATGGGGATGGAGGSAGSAGMATGGVSGSAGSGGTHAGNGGTAGSSTQKECAALAEDYAKALEEALVCNYDSGKDQCTKLVTSNLDCGCGVYVNPDNEEAVAELERISTEAAKRCAVVCPAIVCIPPAAAGCFPDGKQGGRCMAGVNATPF